jgi:uncharacterized MAPEG superfamily protein
MRLQYGDEVSLSRIYFLRGRFAAIDIHRLFSGRRSNEHGDTMSSWHVDDNDRWRWTFPSAAGLMLWVDRPLRVRCRGLRRMGGEMMPLAYWCVLVAALWPLAVVSYAKAGGGDNHHPRDDASRLSGARRRAYAAHFNAYENFPFFAAAVIVAVTQGADTAMLDMLAVIYLLLRILHAVLYVADLATLRSLVFVAALCINIAIFVLPVFK